MIGAVGNALVAQGIEHRFPEPNQRAKASRRKRNEFLVITGDWPRLTAVRSVGNHPLFPTILGNCCAEVVLGFKFEEPE